MHQDCNDDDHSDHHEGVAGHDHDEELREIEDGHHQLAADEARLADDERRVADSRQRVEEDRAELARDVAHHDQHHIHDDDCGCDPKSRFVEIRVGRKTVKVPSHTTGAEIKAAAGVDPTFALFKIEGRDEIEIGDDEKITVCDGDRFTATPSLDPS
jgi:hypothetical protein